MSLGQGERFVKTWLHRAVGHERTFEAPAGDVSADGGSRPALDPVQRGDLGQQLQVGGAVIKEEKAVGGEPVVT
jgi:hypothetical protein